MADAPDSEFDEATALEAMWERLAAPHPRDILKREHERELKGYPRDIALENRGAEIEEMILRDLMEMKERKKSAQVLPLRKPEKAE